MPEYEYLAPDGNVIEEKSDLRDLGVRICNDLTFSKQVELAANAGNQMAGWILRTFRGRGKDLMLTVLGSLIQPRIDYCCQPWSPRDQLSINKLESVQRHFVSRIVDTSLCGLNYWEKLSQLQPWA